MSIKNIAKKVTKWGIVLTSPLWPLWISAPTELVEAIYPEVKNRQEAYQILEEEKQKLGILKLVDLRIYDNNELKEVYIKGYSGISQDGDGFTIGANISDLDRILLRHELYHIYRGDWTRRVGNSKEDDLGYFMPRKENPSLGHPKYFYLMEPRANIYSVTGIKL